MINKVVGKNKTESQNLQQKHKLKTESQNPQHWHKTLQHKHRLKKNHKIRNTNTKLTNTNLIKFVFVSWMVHKETLIDFWKLN